jgi:hypothetical protein
MTYTTERNQTGCYLDIEYPAHMLREMGVLYLQKEISKFISSKFFTNEQHYSGGISGDRRWATLEVWFENKDDAAICLLKFGGKNWSNV